MGVRYLTTYLEKDCPGGTYPVSIKNLIEENEESGQYKNQIVLDGSSTIKHIYGQLDWLCGGQLKEFVDRLETFCKKITQMNCKLIVFMDGAHVSGKQKTWIQRRVYAIKYIEQCFDKLKDGVESDFDYEHVPLALKIVSRMVFLNTDNCELRYSFRACDEEAARYAKMYNSLALIGEDSDYVIFECGDNYLSAKHLNIDTMTTVCYSKTAFLKHTNLTREQLPLFSSLVGNEFITPYELKQFHQKLVRNYSSNFRKAVLEKVVQYVIPLKPDINLSLLCEEIFDDQHMVNKLKQSIDVITYRAKSEDAEVVEDGNWGDVLNLAYQRHRSGLTPPGVYNVLSSLKYYSGNVLEDFRNISFPPIASVLRPLRKNIYGILLYDKSQSRDSHTVVEYCVEGKKHKSQQYAVFPEKVSANRPTVQHPGLVTLWSENNEEINEIKWNLFCSAISPKLKAHVLKKIEPNLIYPTVALFYLHNEIKNKILLKYEIEAFVFQAVQMKNKTVDELKMIKIVKYNSYAIELASKFIETISNIEFLNAVCGFVVPVEGCNISNYFDGKLFHNVFSDAEINQKMDIEILNSKEHLDFVNICKIIFHHDL